MSIFTDFPANLPNSSPAGMCVAEKWSMNLYDFLIIYLAGGAPLGVYYYLQNRKTSDFRHLRLKTFLNFLCWMPYAVRLLSKNKFAKNIFGTVFGGKFSTDAKIEKNIRSVEKRLEKIYLQSRLQISIYEFREILERYAGLTMVSQFEHKNSQIARCENDFFQISGHPDAPLASLCLDRRNRRRLFFHQTEARRDFLRLLTELFDSDSDSEDLSAAAIEFVTTLQDAEAAESIKKMFGRRAQTRNRTSVKNAETEIWKSEIPKPLLTGAPDSTRLKTLAATMNLPGKD